MVDHPGDYQWPSYHCHATGSPASIINDHEVFLRIASTAEARMYCYRELFRTDLDARDVHDVRKAVTFSVPLGNSHFKERIEATLGKSVGYTARGRPKLGWFGDRLVDNNSHVPQTPFGTLLAICELMVQQRVGNRPGRIESRAVKRSRNPFLC